MGRTAVRAVRPWLRAFCEERCLPDSVRGPVECAELARLVAARRAFEYVAGKEDAGESIFVAPGCGHALLRASQRSTGSVVVGIG